MQLANSNALAKLVGDIARTDGDYTTQIPALMIYRRSTATDPMILPFPPRVTDKSYLEVNPLCTVPTLFDGDVRMTESAAICQYLAARIGNTPLNVASNEAGYAAYLNYLHFGEATFNSNKWRIRFFQGAQYEA